MQRFNTTTWTQGPWLMAQPNVTLTPWTWSNTTQGTILRDDLLHPWAGGNKMRKLDGLWPRLVTPDVHDVVTCGGIQSAHCCAVGALAAQHGKRAHLLVRGELPQRLTGHTAMSAMFGTLYPQSRDMYATREHMFDTFFQTHDLDPAHTAIIPEGSDCNEAMLGMIRLVDALRDTLPNRTRLVIDAGTGTSAAGLALGIALLELPWHVEAVCLLKGRIQELRDNAHHRIRAWCTDHDLTPELMPSITWHPRRHPRRFGTFTQRDIDACVAVTRRTGVVMDPLYTLAAWNHCEDTTFDGHTCLIHTGGGLNVFGTWDRRPTWYEHATGLARPSHNT